MNLSKLSTVFSATTTAGTLIVAGHATAAVNGVYTTSDSGTTYSNGTHTFKTSSSKWGIYNGNTLIVEESAVTARPQGGAWVGCFVMEATALAVTSPIVVISLVMTGGSEGGCVAFNGDGITQLYSLAPETVAVNDTKQIFTTGSIYVAGVPGTSAQLSYDTLPTTA